MDIKPNTNAVRVALLHSVSYVKFFFKWIWAAALTGAIGGYVGMFFHKSVAIATTIRGLAPQIMWFMPLAGIIIVTVYKLSGLMRNKGTDAIIESAQSGGRVPVLLAPAIFVGTVLTHLVGGSAGREGAALQLGGCIGSSIGKVFGMNREDIKIIVMCGMSAVFTALFGTPITASFFAMEVISVGKMEYHAIIPCLISAAAAYAITIFYNIPPTHFNLETIPIMNLLSMAQVALIAALCAVLGTMFCFIMHRTGHFAKKFIKNDYLRILAGSAVILLLTMLVGSYDYNGAGVGIISQAVAGEAKPYAFAMKILFTAITLGCGFKGGEIVPTFFIGSTFGCVIASLIGLEPGFGAAVGMTALFCSVVNCPVASVFLSVELFGAEGILMFAVACGISYMLSGYSGLYGSQKFVYSKFKDKHLNITTK